MIRPNASNGYTVEPKRLALVVSHMQCGGIANQLLLTGRDLLQHGFDVEIITTKAPGDWFGRIGELGIKADHIEGCVDSHPVAHSFRVGRRLAAGRYDVIFLSQALHAQAAINMLPSSMIVIPMIRSDHEDEYRIHCLNANAWNVAAAVSPKVAAKAQSIVPHRPVVWVPDGVELPPAVRLQRRRGFERPLRLIFVGRAKHRPKGILFLPEIVRGCRERGLEVSLTIVGEGVDLEATRAKVAELGLTGHVQFRGALAHGEVYDLLLDSHVLLLPSFFEGLPGAPLESQACGCVPIASRLDGITDVVIDPRETGLLVDVGDVPGFVEAIGQIYSQPETWEQMSAAGRRKVSEQFSVEQMGAHYRRLISDALAGRYALPHSRRHYFAVNPGAFHLREMVPHWARRLRRRIIAEG